MNVGIITSFSTYEGTATTNRVLSFVRGLNANNKVKRSVVICPKSQRGDPRNYGKVTFNCIHCPELRKDKKALRAFDEIRSAIILWRSVQNIDLDILIITIPSVFLLWPLIFRKLKYKVVLDVRDTNWTYLTNSTSERFIGLIFKTLVTAALRKISMVSVTNDFEASEIQSMTTKSILKIPNGIASERLSLFCSFHNDGSLRLQNPIELTYFGNVGIAQKLDQLLDWGKSQSGLHIKIIGEGADLEALKTKVDLENITNVSFLGYIPFENLGSEIDTTDILFAQIGSEYSTAVPSKAFEYIASGKRVILGLPRGGIAESVFCQFRGVYIFATGDIDDLSRVYTEAIQSPLSEYEVEFNRALLRREFLRESAADRFIEFLFKL